MKTYTKASYYSKLQIGTAQTDWFGAKIGPKNGPILMKLSIYNHHTSNQKHTKFYQNRTIFQSFKAKFVNQEWSDFNEIWWNFGLKCYDPKYQVSSKSDHFWALFWLPISQFARSQSETWWNNLILHMFSPCGNGFWIGYYSNCVHFVSSLRIWGCCHTQTSHQRPKIFWVVNLLHDRVDWHKFQENWRFWIWMTFCDIGR